MDIEDHIRNILSEKAIIIVGAGGSQGVKTFDGKEFPSGSKLAKYLFEKCNEKDCDDNDLGDASSLFRAKYGDLKLISEIKYILNVGYIPPSQKTIYNLPWIRFYTTNYDNVIPLSIQSASGESIVKITASSDFGQNKNIMRSCLYINGNIDLLTPKTLDSEFKFTKESYLTSENFLSSKWGEQLRDDLNSADSIVILGLSLAYDLDLSKILFNNTLKDKTLIIDAPSLKGSALRNLEKFGTVHKIGLEKFAEKIEEVKKSFIQNPVDTYKLSNFEKYSFSKHNIQPTIKDYYNLFLTGNMDTEIDFCQNLCERRSITSKILEKIRSGKKFIFITSPLGNGKSVLLYLIASLLCKNKYTVFRNTDAIESTLAKDIRNISLNKNPIILIDDYTDKISMLKAFSRVENSNFIYILSTRNALHRIGIQNISKIFNIKEDMVYSETITVLSHDDINKLIDIFEVAGLWQNYSHLNKSQKFKFLTSSRDGNSRLSSILLKILPNSTIHTKLYDILQSVKSCSQNEYDIVFLILLSSIMQFKLYDYDIHQMLNVDIHYLLATNCAINEIIKISRNGNLKTISSIHAKILIRSYFESNYDVKTTLLKLAKYAERHCSSERHVNTLKNIVSYSLWHEVLPISNSCEYKKFIVSYFDEIGKIAYYTKNHNFWLQYAIACMETKDFHRAETYLETAYGYSRQTPDFDPFQIDTQMARLQIEKIKNGISKTPIENLKIAHNILMISPRSELDDYSKKVKIFGLYIQLWDFIPDKKLLLDLVKEAINQIEKFNKKEYDYRSDAIGKKLIKFSISHSAL